MRNRYIKSTFATQGNIQYFPHYCHNIAEGKQLKGIKVYFSSWSEVTVHIGRKGVVMGCEMTGHIVFTVRTHREIDVLFLFHPAQDHSSLGVGCSYSG